MKYVFDQEEVLAAQHGAWLDDPTVDRGDSTVKFVADLAQHVTALAARTV